MIGILELLVIALFLAAIAAGVVAVASRRGEGPQRPPTSRAGIVLACLLVVAIGVLLSLFGARIVALFAPTRLEGVLDPQRLSEIPFTTASTPQGAVAGGLVQVERKTYCEAGYGITDIGDVRIAVPRCVFEGVESGLVPIDCKAQLATDGPPLGTVGTGAGKRAFHSSWDPRTQTTTAHFADFDFSIAHSTLMIGGVEVPVGKGPRVVIVSQSGVVETLLEL